MGTDQSKKYIIPVKKIIKSISSVRKLKNSSRERPKIRKMPTQNVQKLENCNKHLRTVRKLETSEN